MSIPFSQLSSQKDAKTIDADSITAGLWSPELQYLATDSPNGYTALMIVSKKTGILASFRHRADLAHPINVKENTHTLLLQVLKHYDEMSQEGFVGCETNIILATVMGMDQWQPTTMPTIDLVSFVENALSPLGLPIHSEILHVDESYEQTRQRTGPTSVIIQGTGSIKPLVYVGDQPLNYDEALRQGRVVPLSDVHLIGAGREDEYYTRLPGLALTQVQQRRDLVADCAGAHYREIALSRPGKERLSDDEVFRQMDAELKAWINSKDREGPRLELNDAEVEASIRALLYYDRKRVVEHKSPWDIEPLHIAVLVKRYGWTEKKAMDIINGAFQLGPFQKWPTYGREMIQLTPQQIANELLQASRDGTLDQM